MFAGASSHPLCRLVATRRTLDSNGLRPPALVDCFVLVQIVAETI